MDPERGAASSLMCSYNAVNGIPSCADVETLGKARAMGFEGYITSDCGAVQDVYVRPPAPSRALRLALRPALSPFLAPGFVLAVFGCRCYFFVFCFFVALSPSLSSAPKSHSHSMILVFGLFVRTGHAQLCIHALGGR